MVIMVKLVMNIFEVKKEQMMQVLLHISTVIENQNLNLYLMKQKILNINH
jgi:hypothetical protein